MIANSLANFKVNDELMNEYVLVQIRDALQAMN